MVIRLLKRFNKTCYIEEMDTVLKEWQEFKSLPDDNLCTCASLEHFWSCIGQVPLPAGEVGEKRFGNSANFCKLLLVLPHSTADPERHFSIIGRSTHHSVAVFSQALFVTFCLSSSMSTLMKNAIRVRHCLHHITPHLLQQAKTATVRSLSERNNSKSS